MSALRIRHILVALVFLPALYLNFVIYQTGNIWVALAMLIVLALGAFVYLSESAYTFRYLFPGFLGFGLFVIFPIAYMVFLSFTKYSSQNLLDFDRALGLFHQETVSAGKVTYKYKLYTQDDGQYMLYLEDDKDATKRFASDPFELSPGVQPKVEQEPVKLAPLAPTDQVKGTPLEMGQITRQKLLIPMRGRQFALPDDTLVAMQGLLKFGSRTFSGFDNYIRILSDPRIQGPFLRIFLWTVAFSGASVILTFSVGILLAVVLERKDLGFRKGYRTLLILPYAVPAVLSILIFKGMFNQEFGAVNTFLKAIFGFAPEWETNPWGARAMILIVNIWLGYPYMMLICTGMLQSIPSAIYEASSIDGSNPITDFFELTLPLVISPMVPILISSFAFNFNNFNLIYLLTAGGPKMVGGGIAGETDLLVNYTFNIAFRDSGTNYGLASAIATLLFLVVGFLSWMNLRLSGKNAKL